MTSAVRPTDEYLDLKEFRVLSKVLDQVSMISPNMPITRLRMFLEIAAHPNCKLKTIADGIDVTQSSASRHLGGLTEGGSTGTGLVHIQSQNGRDYELHLTQKGRLLLKNLLSVIREMEGDIDEKSNLVFKSGRSY